MTECQRCGRCCLETGRTFWKNGLIEAKPFDGNSVLIAKATNGDHEDGGLPCEMLVITDGKAVCLIERDYGREAKPCACREYPEVGELCFREQCRMK